MTESAQPGVDCEMVTKYSPIFFERLMNISLIYAPLYSEFAVAEFRWPYIGRLLDQVNLIHGICLPQPGSVHLINNFG